ILSELHRARGRLDRVQSPQAGLPHRRSDTFVEPLREADTFVGARPPLRRACAATVAVNAGNESPTSRLDAVAPDLPFRSRHRLTKRRDLECSMCWPSTF